MIVYIRRLLCGPTDCRMAQLELEEARRDLLKAQTGEEFAHSQVVFNQNRIARLQAYLAKHGPATDDLKSI